jgi:hypothetical protein
MVVPLGLGLGSSVDEEGNFLLQLVANNKLRIRATSKPLLKVFIIGWFLINVHSNNYFKVKKKFEPVQVLLPFFYKAIMDS